MVLRSRKLLKVNNDIEFSVSSENCCTYCVFSYLINKPWNSLKKFICGIGSTTNTGWSCKLCCGQMVLAHALINHHLGRGMLTCSYQREPTMFCVVIT
ncbi:cysteine protease ATG4B-like isoform X3 [Tachypleus tridentatus]|uniref:cysteine protease ATG4B-like isoform X3 n=1 Tax=Tachypleus tridentatus TaxID=6853 RepID=UPI003FD0702B